MLSVVKGLIVAASKKKYTTAVSLMISKLKYCKTDLFTGSDGWKANVEEHSLRSTGS